MAETGMAATCCEIPFCDIYNIQSHVNFRTNPCRLLFLHHQAGTNMPEHIWQILRLIIWMSRCLKNRFLLSWGEKWREREKKRQTQRHTHTHTQTRQRHTHTHTHTQDKTERIDMLHSPWLVCGVVRTTGRESDSLDSTQRVSRAQRRPAFPARLTSARMTSSLLGIWPVTSQSRNGFRWRWDDWR